MELVKIRSVVQESQSDGYAKVKIVYFQRDSQFGSSTNTLKTILKIREYQADDVDTGPTNTCRIILVSASGRDVIEDEMRRVLKTAGPNVKFV